MLKQFFLRKWKFSIDSNIDIIVFEKNDLGFKFKNLKKIYYYEELYLFIAFKTLLNHIFNKKINNLSITELYLYNLVIKSNPKVAIGNDVNLGVFIFKKLFPKKTSAAYQFGYLYDDIQNNHFRGYLRKYSLDYYFVYDLRSKKILEKYIKCNFIIIGSLKANFKCILEDKKKYDYDIMYISNFRPLDKKEKFYKMNKYFQQNDSFFIKIISEYCKKNKLKFCISFSSKRKDKIGYNYYKQELDFYRKNAKNFIINDKESYTIAAKSNLIIGSFSNLTYELLLSCKKVSVFYKSKFKKWQFVNNNSKDYVFISDKKNMVEKKLNLLLSLSKSQWKKRNIGFYKNNKFDQKNMIFNNLIKNRISSER